MSNQVTKELLKEFLQAFNRHDLDSIMEYFADDCVFYTPRGAKPRGNCFVGKDDVRTGLAKRFEGIPNMRYGDGRHWSVAILESRNGPSPPRGSQDISR